MRFKINITKSDSLLVGGIAVGWLVFISFFHVVLHQEESQRRVVTMGYMPVITNMAAPLLDYASIENEDVRFKAMKFSSFAEMAESLRNGQIDAAFMIAPLSVVLHQQGEDVKIVYIGNRNESTLVAKSSLNVTQLSDLVGKTVAVPMRYSGHNLSLLKTLDDNGLTDKVNIVEMNPPDMASALSTGSLDAYYVGEPFAAQTLKTGSSSLVHYVEEVWPSFICNLTVVRDDLIKKEPEVVELLVSGAVRSGIWAKANPEEAAEIASQYWNQPLDIIKYAMGTPKGRIDYDEYTPKEDEIQYLANLMTTYGLIESNNVKGLVNDSFAKGVDISKPIESVSDILN